MNANLNLKLGFSAFKIIQSHGIRIESTLKLITLSEYINK